MKTTIAMLSNVLLDPQLLNPSRLSSNVCPIKEFSNLHLTMAKNILLRVRETMRSERFRDHLVHSMMNQKLFSNEPLHGYEISILDSCYNHVIEWNGYNAHLLRTCTVTSPEPNISGIVVKHATGFVKW